MATSTRESKRPAEPEAEAANKRAAVTPVDDLPATAMTPSDAAGSARAAPVATPQLPYLFRGLDALGKPVQERKEWTVGFASWDKKNIDEVRDMLASQKQRDIGLASKYPPELWACDADGNPTGRLNVCAIELLQWTASTAHTHPLSKLLLESHEGDPDAPRAFMLFTLPEAAKAAAYVAPVSREELEKALEIPLNDVCWSAVTQHPTLLSRTSAPVFTKDLPCYKQPYVPDMTLAPHPDDSYTHKRANDVLRRLQVMERACARLLVSRFALTFASWPRLMRDFMCTRCQGASRSSASGLVAAGRRASSLILRRNTRRSTLSARDGVSAKMTRLHFPT